MLYCEKCKVHVKGRAEYCPLCQGPLVGNVQGGEVFPTIAKKHKWASFWMKLALFFTVAGVFICGATNYMMYESLKGWWLYVAAGALSFWIPFKIGYSFRRDLPRCIMFTSFTCYILAILWDVFTGYTGWSVDIVLPSLCCVAMLAMAVIARIQKLRIEVYIYYLIVDIIFGIVPLIFMLCKIVRFVYPSVICVASSAISLTALFIFEGKALKAEFIRRTHL